MPMSCSLSKIALERLMWYALGDGYTRNMMWYALDHKLIFSKEMLDVGVWCHLDHEWFVFINRSMLDVCCGMIWVTGCSFPYLDVFDLLYDVVCFG